MDMTDKQAYRYGLFNFSLISRNVLLIWEVPQLTTYLTALHTDVPQMSLQVNQSRSVKPKKE